mmetsp:Transcript_45803/g.90213  ORF Transcript_45803/g.90213 Transcript_45803/m.90213 type:complete len:126 (-) Transcript_45803:278-655(-)
MFLRKFGAEKAALSILASFVCLILSVLLSFVLCILSVAMASKRRMDRKRKSNASAKTKKTKRHGKGYLVYPPIPFFCLPSHLPDSLPDLLVCLFVCIIYLCSSQASFNQLASFTARKDSLSLPLC